MARGFQTRGICAFCGKDYTKGWMARHLVDCPERTKQTENSTGRKKKLFHLAVEGEYNPWYWMNIELPKTATLSDLDRFLRDIWLECCGHLSAFRIDGKNFIAIHDMDMWWNDEDRDMEVRLGKTLYPGLEFSHEYDFGTTTYLKLRVVEECDGKSDEIVRIMARNNPPEFICEHCGSKPATRVYPWENYAVTCDACGDESGYDDEGWLPVVNSPRVGECGYTGSQEWG